MVSLLWKTGRPKYLKEVQEEEAAKPRHLDIAESILGEVFQLKIWHLFLLTALREASLKSSKTTLNLEAEERVALPKSSVSSANKAWFMLLTPLAIHSPLISWSCFFLSNRKLRTEAWMTKSRGERGHPCLSPLQALKKSVALPFTRGAIHGYEIHARIHFMKFTPKPNLHMTF